ncbi:MAG: AzlC family ABC transporter permease [Clostridia bacterium]|nr:AzlC family ABC transporter permease [Clostridia bacterium]
MKNSIFKTAFRDTLPIMAGYLVLGMGFGIIMSSKGYSVWWSLIMSITIYAGSMQYAAVGLLTGGASYLTVALTTLAVNARHFFYGITMIDKYKNTGLKKPYLMFALTDETYSLVCRGDKDKNYYFYVSLLDHSYWITGCTLGALIGSKLTINTAGVDFSLTALFITVFCDQWINGKDHFSALTGVGSAVICLLIFGSADFLIPSMVLIAVILLLRLFKEGKNAV